MPIPESASPTRLRRRSRETQASRPRNGQALGALVDKSTHTDAEVRSIPLDEIGTSVRNPRRKLTGIEELAGSLQQHGLLQPIVVRLVGDQYQLVAGHRRLAAARALGWQRVPAIVRREAEDDAYLLTLVENLQRVDLSARDEAEALEVLVRKRGWSTRDVAAAIYRSQAFVSKRLRVFEDALLAPVVLAGRLSVSAAEELLTVSERHRYELLDSALELGWEYSEIRQAVKQQRFESNPDTPRPRPGLSRRMRALRMDLQGLELKELRPAEQAEVRRLLAELRAVAESAPSSRRSPANH